MFGPVVCHCFAHVFEQLLPVGGFCHIDEIDYNNTAHITKTKLACDFVGGGSIYTALLGRCRRACVTRVDAAAENADTFFPNLDALPEWTVERTEAPVTENGLTYRFVDYVNTAL